MSKVVSVSKDAAHRFSKVLCDQITLIAGEGVEGDAHRGVTVKHRSRVKLDPNQPNLRQVHLIQIEIIESLQAQGFGVGAATIGENIATRGIDLLALPRDTRVVIGQAEIQITGLRNPCGQLDGYQKGLTAALLDKTKDGELVRKAGIMGIVLSGGIVKPNDVITVHLPATPHHKLERV
ncbi:MAG: MOSC domain-containing protein YiiM [Candidatus Azotimanducaceae bacterium]|jgi:MOSC domain-containing protein YiiM